MAAIGSDRGRMPLWFSIAMLLPILLLLAVAFFYPISKLLLQSLFDPELTARHYQKLVAEPLYLRVLLRTIWISALVSVLVILLGYPIAYLMSRLRGVAAALVAACVLVPLWTSVLVRSYAWIVILQRNGLINNFLINFGIIERPLTMIYTEFALVLAMAHVLLPFMILPIYTTLRSIPADLVRAAKNLGASEGRAFRTVTLPLSVPGVFAGSLMVFILALGFYVTPALVGGPRAQMIATLISQQVGELLNWPFAGALAAVLLVTATGIAVGLRRFIGLDRMVAHD